MVDCDGGMYTTYLGRKGCMIFRCKYKLKYMGAFDWAMEIKVSQGMMSDLKC